MDWISSCPPFSDYVAYLRLLVMILFPPNPVFGPLEVGVFFFSRTPDGNPLLRTRNSRKLAVQSFEEGELGDDFFFFLISERSPPRAV